MVMEADNRTCFTMPHGNRRINVTLEFPVQSDEEAEQEFISRLKMLYLEKNDIYAEQKGKEGTSFE